MGVGGSELLEGGLQELFAFVVDGGPLIGSWVASGAEEFVVEDRPGCADEIDDAGDVPLPGVLVTEHINRHGGGIIVEPVDRVGLASLRWEEEPGDRKPERSRE